MVFNSNKVIIILGDESVMEFITIILFVIILIQKIIPYIPESILDFLRIVDDDDDEY